MKEAIVMWITGVFGEQAGKFIAIIFISMLPVIELRGAIPVAFALGLNWRTALLCVIFGNLVPVPFILLFVEAVFAFMKKHHILDKWVIKLENKAVAKSDQVTKYQFWGLMLFVAIPLPGTGAWTGALIASVMKMNKVSAFISIALGVLIAGIIVTVAAYGLVGSMIR